VAHLDRSAVAAELAGHIHEASEIAGEEEGAAGLGDALRLVLDNGIGDVGILHREGAAEAAAGVPVGHLDDLEAVYGGKKLARLRADAELAEPRAGIVIGRPGLPADIDFGDATNVHEEGHELVAACGKRLGPGAPCCIRLKKLGIVPLDHAAAGARGHDHIVEGLEGGDGLAGEVDGLGPCAAIVGGLPAAGLRRRHLDDTARILEQLHGSKADARAKQVDEARHEETDARRLARLCCLGHRFCHALISSGRTTILELARRAEHRRGGRRCQCGLRGS
jgi:hypothetical protein